MTLNRYVLFGAAVCLSACNHQPASPQPGDLSPATLVPGERMAPLIVRPRPLAPESWASQRKAFQEAENALAQGQAERYRTLKEGLRDYPLYPYLIFEQLRGSLATLKASDMERFQADYGDTSLASQLRRKWLKSLAISGRWTDYLKGYHPTLGVAARCEFFQALMETGRGERLYPLLPKLWLTGKSLPGECDPVVATWRRIGGLSNDLVWQRIRLAMADKQTSLAASLGSYLVPADKPWLDLWLMVYEEPAKILEEGRFAAQHPQREAILVSGFKRYADKNPDQAEAVWRTLQSRYGLSGDEARDGEEALGLALVKLKSPTALESLDRLPPRPEASIYQRKRITLALTLGDWDRVIRWIEALPAKERDSDPWVYWLARALEQRKGPEAAAPMFRKLAGNRSFYGFLAADRLKLPYPINNRVVAYSREEGQAITSQPGVQRAYELRQLGRLAETRKEWRWLTRQMDRRTLSVAARLAYLWGWNDLAIATVTRAEYWDDLEIRFPLLYRAEAEREALAHGLNPAWVMAIMRQESIFALDAQSSAGARGLMQLMPTTASHVARGLGLKPPSSDALFMPDLNIRLGTAYLETVFNQLNRQAALATAAYNAGPHRVKSWLSELGHLPTDLWIESIPFRETRDYVMRVMQYTLIYEHRMGLPNSVLSQNWLQPVGSGSP
ncbi:MAG: transglycosylase SLT domain-containing protein [Pseudomonadota bacterium]